MADQFDEQALLAAIVEKWGTHGAHAAVCRYMVDEIASLRAENARLHATAEALHTANHQAMWDDTLLPIADALGVTAVDEHGEPRRQFQMVDAITAGIRNLRYELDLARSVRPFVCLWWDDPLEVGRACAAWDQLPEDARMWVLDDGAADATDGTDLAGPAAQEDAVKGDDGADPT
jgi:hypothetical protein